MVYAGFWRRLGAHILDSVIIAFVGVFLAVVLVVALGQVGDSNAQAILQQLPQAAPVAPAQPPAEVMQPSAVPAPVQPAINQPVVTPEPGLERPLQARHTTNDEEGAVGVFMLIVGLLRIIIGAFYHTLFLASKWQATPGKRLVGAMVVSREGKRIGIFRSFARHVSCIISAAILLIGYAMIGWTREKTALHDLICDTRVIRGEA